MEIEAHIDNRPLKYVSPSLANPETLMPAHLQSGRNLTSLPHGNVIVTTDDNHTMADVTHRLND